MKDPSCRSAASSTGVLNEPETGLEGVSFTDSLEDVDTALLRRLKLDFSELNILFRFESECCEVREEA